MKKVLVSGIILGLVLASANLTAEGVAEPQVACGGDHSLGLKSDGTVVAAGPNGPGTPGQCNVESWTDVVEVAGG